MSSSKDYMERLRNIRDKYGVSQPKPYPEAPVRHSQHQQAPERSSVASYLKPEVYGMERRKLAENTANYCPLFVPGRSDYLCRPHSSIGISPTEYAADGYSRKVEREREADKGVLGYSASRKRLEEELNSKAYTRNYSREVPRLRTDSTMPSRSLLGRDYSRAKEEFKNPETANLYSHSRKNLVEKTEDYISPIKRMTEYEEKKSYRDLEPTDSCWREKEARLSELTSNRLNESHRISLFKEEKLGGQRKELEIEPRLKSYTQLAPNSRLQAENRPYEHPNPKLTDYSILSKHKDYLGSNRLTDPLATRLGQQTGSRPSEHSGNRLSQLAMGKGSDYSLSNIDRIQQRIQSILGKR